MTTQQPVVVIGSGFGGLAAAVRMRAKGYPVIVLEARDQPGGRASVFLKDGFSFDAGPTVITAPYLFHELFELVGRDWRDYYELMPVDPFYRIAYDDGSVFDYVGDEERLLAQIRAFNPRDVDGYRKLADHSRRIFEVGYEQLADVPFDQLSDMLRIVPQMLKLGNYRTVYGLVSHYIKDERLRQAFTFQPLLVGGNPFQTTSIYLLIHWLERKWGVHFPKGGTTSLVKALVQLLDELEVEVRLNTAVDEIEVDASGRACAVRTASGERIACQMVISNADPLYTYQHMVDPAHRRKHTDRAVQRVKPSMGLFVGYFGTDRTYPELAHHTIILGPRYKGLLDDIFEHLKLADDFSLYMHAPTRSDPDLAPPGHEGFYVLSPVPNNRSGLDWDEIGEAYFDKILGALERHVPDLREHLVTKFHVTPNYFEQELRSIDGAGFGPEPKLSQSAYFRFHNRSEDLDGLYFVGAGTHPGAGLPGVLSTAKVLERMIPDAPQGRLVETPTSVSALKLMGGG